MFAQAVCGLRCYNILSKINLKDGSFTNHYSEEESNAIDLINKNGGDYSGAGSGLTAPPKVVDPYKLVIKVCISHCSYASMNFCFDLPLLCYRVQNEKPRYSSQYNRFV